MSINIVNKLVLFAGLYTGSAVFLKLSGFVLFLWLARVLAVDDYARFGLLYAVQTGLTAFALAGIIEAVVGLLKDHRSQEMQTKLFTSANIAFLVIGTIVGCISFAILIFFVDDKNVSGFMLFYVLVSGVLLAYAFLQAQIVRLQENHFHSLLYSFFPPFTGLFGSFSFFYFERTVHSFFVGTAAGVTLSILGLWLARVGFYGVHAKWVDARIVLLKCIPFIAVAFLGWLSGYGNNFVINVFFESSVIAKFTFALTVSSIMQLIATALNQVWSPRFYRITHELPFEDVEIKNRRFYRLQGIALGCVGCVVIAVYPLAIDLLGGNLVAYKSMSLELFLLFSAYILLSPWWHCNNYFLAYGKGRSIMNIVLITSIIGIAIWLLLMWLIGPIGVYVGFFTQMLVRSVGIVIATKRYWPVRACWDGVAIGMLIISVGFFISA